jgi:uncharacterized cupredoxin-like copper-binding protein
MVGAGAGGRETLRVTLQRTGAYRLLCMKPGPAGLGMRATLRVSRRPVPRRPVPRRAR